MNEKHKNKRLYIKVAENTALFSGLTESAKAESIPYFVNELSSALNELSELDNTGKLRGDAIRNGKAIIKHWQPPTNEQIDKILFNMKHELLA